MTTHTHAPSRADAAAAVVRGFLDALQRGDLDAALDLVDPDLVYENVTLPTVRGRAGLDRAFRPLFRPASAGFAVHVHHLGVESNATTDVVLTDRTDELSVGRFHARFWVYGRFEVRDGLITLWRDAFDWFDIGVGMVRALVGIVLPAANRTMPGR
jgi:limonene-1,2-epoxide hydrolase